jgi:hypothetical protein
MLRIFLSLFHRHHVIIMSSSLLFPFFFLLFQIFAKKKSESVFVFFVFHPCRAAAGHTIPLPACLPARA